MAPRHEPAEPLLSRRRRLSGIAALATASLLTTGGVALAGGVSPDRPGLGSTAREAAAHDRAPHRFPGVWGTVTAVGDGTFTVESRNGETTDVVTTGDTTYLDTTRAEVADIEVGAHLVVAGPRSEGAGIDARHLAVKPAPADGAEGKRWMHDVWRSGTVVANDGATLTVETPEGTVTVHTSETTSVTITTEASFDAVDVGDRAKVRGSVGDDGTVTAERIHLGIGGKGHDRSAATTTTTQAPTTTVAPTTTAAAPEPTAAATPPAEVPDTLVEGTVTAIEAPAFTVKADDGTVTSVMTTEATAWGARHGRTGDWGSIESLEVGDRVLVKGTVAAGGTLVASYVDIKGDHDEWRRGDHDDDRWDDDGREHGDWGQDDSDRDDGWDDGDRDDDGHHGESWDGRGDGDRGHGERGHEGRRGRGHRGGRH